ncbi:hypothetical protein LINPERPRIM_LOCUS14808 [Linum perenne]
MIPNSGESLKNAKSYLQINRLLRLIGLRGNVIWSLMLLQSDLFTWVIPAMGRSLRTGC